MIRNGTKLKYIGAESAWYSLKKGDVLTALGEPGENSFAGTAVSVKNNAGETFFVVLAAVQVIENVRKRNLPDWF